MTEVRKVYVKELYPICMQCGREIKGKLYKLGGWVAVCSRKCRAEANPKYARGKR